MAKHVTTPSRKRPSRLASEPSPYLRQHADNPVDWWPWGPEAFAEAKRRDVPVFLSIGYATCHWCHVMAHESFEDPQAADALNAAFVCIKVDREERPDVDEAYMAVCQAMTGSGGWPLTILMTPDKLPFLAGTYFPKQSRHGRMGVIDLAERVREAWRDERQELLKQAEHVVAHLQQAPRTAGLVPRDATRNAVDALMKRFDAKNGGFGNSPKFPSPANLLFLMDESIRQNRPEVHQAVLATLKAMAQGGIHDHVAGGFHRYSTDAGWHLPHFEKMLYDQALLALAYTQAYQITPEPWLARVIRRTVDFVLREWKAPTGGYVSATDADTEGEEGTTFIWTPAEIRAVLGKDANTFCEAFGVREAGNFHDEATREPVPANVLHLQEDPSPRWDAALEKLRQARAKRPQPTVDDKVLTDWNGLWLAALSRAGAALPEPRYLAAAKELDAFLDGMVRDGRLRHRVRQGVVDDYAFIDDYAMRLWGLLEYVDATQDATRLRPAVKLAKAMVSSHFDGRVFHTRPKNGEALPIARSDAYDGAMPSGTGVAALVLIRLSQYTSDEALAEPARLALAHYARDLEAHPQAFPTLLSAHTLDASGGLHVVVSQSDAMWRIARTYAPGRVPIRLSDAWRKNAPWLADYPNTPAAYVCQNRTCDAPVTTPEALERLLQNRAKS